MVKILLIWRYFTRKRMALIAVAAVTLIVMMVLVVLSVMSGLLQDTRKRNHDWTGDIVMTRDSLVGFPYYEQFIEEVKRLENVEAATAVIKTYGLVGPEGGDSAQIIGIKPAEYCQVTNFKDTLFYQADAAEPSLSRLQRNAERQKLGCIPGVYLAMRRYLAGFDRADIARLREIGMTPAANLPWELTVFGLSEHGTLAGAGLGERQVFRYVDDSDSGLADIDQSTVYVDFDQLQRLCYMDRRAGQTGRAGEIRIKLRDGSDLQQERAAIRARWQQFLGQYPQAKQRNMTDVKVQTWKEYRREYIAPAEKEKAIMILVFVMIGFVGVAIIFAVFYMIVTEKIKDLAIVKSLGASSWTTAQIFLGYGLAVGIAGSIAGTVMGVIIVKNSNAIEGVLNKWFGFRLWDPALYTIDKIPDKVDYRQAAVIFVIAVGAALAGAIIPANRASKLDVVEALRVD